MGDPRHVHLFAEYITALLPRSARMADVASGRGILQAALRERGFSHVTSWDRRRRSPYNRHSHRYGWFRHDTPDQYDAVVAMHPDEGTDHAILYAERHHIPAIICPCCVRPSAQPFWEPTKYHLWSAHVERMARTVSLHVRWDRLPMNGRNDVMILTLNQRAVGSTPTRPTKFFNNLRDDTSGFRVKVATSVSSRKKRIMRTFVARGLE